MTANPIWYHLYPLGMLGAEARNPSPNSASGPTTGRLLELIDWLDPLVELGINALMLGPVLESESHGYDVVNPFRIDRRLGSEADFRQFIEACHQRSLSVGLDVVFHHVGRSHPFFLDVIEQRQASPHCHWFHLDFDARGHDGFGYANFEGHGELVKLNHGQPEVLQWAADVAGYWLDRGVDAFRIDAAYAIPAPFLAALAERLRARRPELPLIGEVIHGDYVSLARSARLSTVTQYELWKAIWSSLNDRNFYELAHALERHAMFCQHFSPWNFVGNHDTTRIATKLDDRRHVSHALAVLLTVPGTPAIYAGDEQGAEGTKYDRPGGDDEIRRPLPCPLADLTDAGLPMWQLHRDLIAVRRQRPWLTGGRLIVSQLDNRSITFEVHAGEHRLVTVLNTDDRPFVGRVPSGLAPVAGHPIAAPRASELSPHGWGIWASA